MKIKRMNMMLEYRQEEVKKVLGWKIQIKSLGSTASPYGILNSDGGLYLTGSHRKMLEYCEDVLKKCNEYKKEIEKDLRNITMYSGEIDINIWKGYCKALGIDEDTTKVKLIVSDIEVLES